jgi:hypothetical protein
MAKVPNEYADHKDNSGSYNSDLPNTAQRSLWYSMCGCLISELMLTTTLCMLSF